MMMGLISCNVLLQTPVTQARIAPFLHPKRRASIFNPTRAFALGALLVAGCLGSGVLISIQRTFK